MSRPGIPPSGTGHRTAGGQPRPVQDALRPTAAERARTLLESQATASLSLPGNTGGADPAESGPAARAVTPSGDVLVLVSRSCPAARAAAHARGDEVVCALEITDVAPIAVRQRIRGRALVGGWLTPVPDADRAAGAALLAERDPVAELLAVGEPTRLGTPPARARHPGWSLLRLEVGEAYVADLWGEGDVEPDELADAEADPLVRCEAELLHHLDACHRDELRSLCGLLGDELRRDLEAREACGARQPPVPVSLDRFGLRVRFADRTDAPFDVRFDFSRPVRDADELRAAMHGLFHSADE